MKLPFVSRKAYEELNENKEMWKNSFFEELKESNSLRNDYREKINRLNTHVNDLESELNMVKFEKESYELEIKEYEVTFKELNELKEELEKDIATKDGEIKSLKDHIENFKKVFNYQNLCLWTSQETQSRLRQYANEILEDKRITKFDIHRMLMDFAMYLGGAYPKNFKVEETKEENKGE